jgi:nicotinamide-nucleotide amidase
MINAEIIAVGSELLLGQIVNTNARYISEHLAEIGINVYYHTVVGDNPDRLIQAIQIAESRSSLIIFTGGLGPTKDDLTKESIAKHLNESLVMDEHALESIKEYFHKTNRVMSENNKKQALVLSGSKVLVNENGMAPGMFYTAKSHSYMLLPGPPKEMEPMFLDYGKPVIAKYYKKNETIFSTVLRFFGIGEAQLETEIMDLIDGQTNPTIAPLAADGEVTLRLTAKAKSETEAKLLVQEKEKQIIDRVGEFFYGYDHTSLMDELTIYLKQTGQTIAAAESLTGGLFQSELSSIAGASNVFNGGIVSYSNEVKKDLLNVLPETIEQFGSVSKECAIEMATNIRKMCKSTIGISFTGVAGPDKLEGKERGTVWIGICRENMEPKAYLLQLAGDRKSNRLRSVKYGCFYLLKEM